MATPLNQNTTPCFCSKDCPGSTKPHKKYAIRTDLITLLPTYEFHKLFEVSSLENPPFVTCFWNAVEPSGAPIVSELFFLSELIVPPRRGYLIELKIDDGLGGVREFAIVNEWDDEELPLLPGDSRNCDTPWVLPAATPPQVGNAWVSPCPEWVCDDQQLRDWCFKTGACF